QGFHPRQSTRQVLVCPSGGYLPGQISSAGIGWKSFQQIGYALRIGFSPFNRDGLKRIESLSAIGQSFGPFQSAVRIVFCPGGNNCLQSLSANLGWKPFEFGGGRTRIVPCPSCKNCRDSILKTAARGTRTCQEGERPFGISLGKVRSDGLDGLI